MSSFSLLSSFGVLSSCFFGSVKSRSIIKITFMGSFAVWAALFRLSFNFYSYVRRTNYRNIARIGTILIFDICNI